MSSVMAAGGAEKERQKRSTSAAVMRATSMREGAFSSRLMVGCMTATACPMRWMIWLNGR